MVTQVRSAETAFSGNHPGLTASDYHPTATLNQHEITMPTMPEKKRIVFPSSPTVPAPLDIEQMPACFLQVCKTNTN